MAERGQPDTPGPAVPRRAAHRSPPAASTPAAGASTPVHG